MSFPVRSVGVVGGGVVGRATARTYLEYCEVKVHDLLPERSTHSLGEALQCDIVFVCLPTPQGADCRCDTTVIDKFFKSILTTSERNSGGENLRSHFVLRSTVPIGFTKSLKEKYDLCNMVHSPEFLTARCAATDAQIPSRNILGYPGKLNSTVDLLTKVYRQRFPGIPTLWMTSDESEAVKLFLNGFFAVKVAYFNEIYQLVTAKGLDWNSVRMGMLSDGRISHSHTQVPGPDGKKGFGGECLPKDLCSLMMQIADAGGFAAVTGSAVSRNIVDRGDVK